LKKKMGPRRAAIPYQVLPPLADFPKTMKRISLSLLCLSVLTLSAVAQDQSTPAADNSGRNQRDRSMETKTSGDQSESSADINITAAIRRAVMHEDSLSMMAKNVKIITADGVVTLRGPV
jgi:osmotically-inducible protein OsmY